MNKFLDEEQRDKNSVSISELDKQIMLGNWSPVCINDGRIVGTEEEA
ncbi:hypothetical protein [Lacrimispora celerecrescens]|uniref:Uncharacterized protein n=1 Tax=[Clostridium] celerecrescens 18A TaxID=1286362 RepID=A0A2M8Z2R2_9FIRM|nr:hypothetical protein [Lacrimispora celerecrescens]PJJ27747.1 hypothetical protein H171_1223 [[Clostridium] celerecrescens 18A]